MKEEKPYAYHLPKKTKKNEKVKNMYHCMEIRRMDKFKMIKANTKRYELSAIPCMRENT